MTGEVWKVGELARTSGLTVRTLHHYDALGLVRPSHRSPVGHRLYDAGDVDNLYRVVALRQLGFTLETIAAVLDGHVPIVDVLEQHRVFLDGRVEHARRARSRVETILAAGANYAGSDFLQLIQEVVDMDETVSKYFDDEQLATLAKRRERVGTDAVAAVENAWPVLIAKVQKAVDDGQDPASAESAALAAQWMELLEAFHGGDEGLKDSLYRMQSEHAEQIVRDHGGPGPELIEFVTKANHLRAQ